MAEGEPIHSLQVVKTGLVMLGQLGPQGRSKPLALVGRGHTLGARAVSKAPALMWARAQSPVVTCQVSLSTVSASCFPAVQALLPELYSRTLMALADWTQVVRVAQLRSRVLTALELLAKLQGGGARVLLPRQADLAELLCITRESWGRVIRTLEAEGVLARVDRSYVDMLGHVPTVVSRFEALDPRQ